MQKQEKMLSRLGKLSLAKQHLFEQILQGEAPEVTVPVAARLSIEETPQTFPLSSSQQRFWFLQELEPEGSSYNEASAFRFKGRMELAAFKRAVREIIQRHAVMRCTFQVLEGQLVQVVHPCCEQEDLLAVIDLRSGPLARRETDIQYAMDQERLRPFRLAEQAPWRFTLLQCDEDDYIFLAVMHHIITDAWSTEIFLRELGTLSLAFASGLPSPLPALHVQYTDYVRKQQQTLEHASFVSSLNYWKEQLANQLPILELPTDRPRSDMDEGSHNGGAYAFLLPPGLLKALHARSLQEDVTLFMALLTAFKIVLHRYTQLTDVIVGSPIADRPGREYEQLLGCFLNTLVLRSNLAGDPDIRTLLKRVRQVTLDALDHANVPFERLVEELQPARILNHSPLIQVLFMLQNMPVSAVQRDDITIEQVELGIVSAKADIALLLQENDEGLHVSIEYNRDLFDASRMERMAYHFQRVLEVIVADPTRRISEIDLLSAEEQQWLFARNEIEPVPPRTPRLHELFEMQVTRTPRAPAILFGQEELSYEELNQRANQLAHYLQSAGVGPQTLVGICLERSLTMVISILAVLKAGGGYVPLDPAHPVERLAFIMRDAQVGFLLTQSGKNLSDYPASVMFLDTLWQTIERESIANLDCVVGDHDIAYVMYTSGSTGLPKGVVIEHGGLGSMIAAHVRIFNAQPHDRIAHFASFSFDVSVTEMFTAFLVGAQLFLIPQEERWPAPLLEHYLQEHTITMASFPPSVLAQMSSERLPDLRTVISAGEELARETALRWSAGRQMFDAYGPTEGTVFATIARCSPERRQPSIGYPVPGTQAYILDTHHRFVPIGAVGELSLGGIGIARGYINRPELTSERFIPDPFSDVAGACLYRTGDRARYLSDGSVEYLGRTDNQVKIRGYRIELEDIESVLRAHPMVQDCAVSVWQETENDKRLVAYVVVSDTESIGNKPGLSEVRAFLKAKLPEYMVPAYLVFLSTLPLTVNGKLDRRGLPAPTEIVNTLSTAFIAPSTETEKRLSEVWCSLLHIQQIGRDDSFFEVGGHSLLLTLMLIQVQEVFHVNLSLRTAFQAPTLAEFAIRIDQMQARGTEVAKSAITLAPRQAIRAPVSVLSGQISDLEKNVEL